MANRDRVLIEKLQHGGYVVLSAPGGMNGDHGYLIQALAAFSDIDDALGFIKGELGEPEKAEKPSIVTTDVTAKVCGEKLPPLPERPTWRSVRGIV